MNTVLVLPTFNEKGNIERLIFSLEEDVFPKIKTHKMAILVVDDQSPDGTADIVRGLMKKWDNIHLIEDKKQGLGAAYLRGMTYAIEKMDAEVLFEMDSDLSHDPHLIPEFLKKVDAGYDLVVGARYIRGGSIPSNWGINRKLFSILGNLLVRGILMRFYVHEWTNGYRAVRKEVFLKIKPELVKFRGYTFQVSFLHKAIQHGFKVAEIPNKFTDRTLGQSKIASSEYITDLLIYIITARVKELIHSPFLKYAITGFLGYIINAVSLEVFVDLMKLHPFFGALFAAELAVIWNFIVNNTWSFKHHRIDISARLLMKFLQFNLVSAGSLAINSSIIFIATHIFGNTALVRQIALIIAIGFFVIPYSYSMYNIFIWKRWHISFLSRLQEKIG